MKNKLKLTVVILFTSLAGYAQRGSTPDSLTLAAMEKIQFLSGNWSGEGWIQMGKEKHFFSQEEKVESKLKGSVIVIDGLGKEKEGEKIIHQAFAVISYDMHEKKYMMRAYKADGNYVDANVTVEDDGSFVWGFTHPQAGQMKYTIKLIDNKWVEKGEMNRDGQRWIQFFEMTLNKI
ncbi:MAG: hypothetical protein KA444_05425 [Bacteroidia bacterium]|nr:hypothetical protein [Bacteroidia bacterium]